MLDEVGDGPDALRRGRGSPSEHQRRGATAVSSPPVQVCGSGASSLDATVIARAFPGSCAVTSGGGGDEYRNTPDPKRRAQAMIFIGASAAGVLLLGCAKG